jgi:hypothetical protein
MLTRIILHEEKMKDFEDLYAADPNSGCWVWLGAVNPKGYGKVMRQGFHLAHRWSWFLSTGDDPGKMCVLHKCDVPSCVNPDHLFLGTVHDNNKDRDEKGRTRRGSDVPGAKLSAGQAKEIFSRKAENKHDLACEYNVSECTIRGVWSGRTWSHATA